MDLDNITDIEALREMLKKFMVQMKTDYTVESIYDTTKTFTFKKGLWYTVDMTDVEGYHAVMIFSGEEDFYAEFDLREATEYLNL